MRVIYVLSQFRVILFHSYFNQHKTPTRTNQQKSAGSSPRFPEIGIQSPPLDLLICRCGHNGLIAIGHIDIFHSIY